MIVGSIHLYSTGRTGPFGQTKDTEDLARINLSADTPLEALRSLRVLVDTLEQEMSQREGAKKVMRDRRAEPIPPGYDEDDEGDEDGF